MTTLEYLQAFIRMKKTGNVCAERNIAARSRNHCCSGEKKDYIFWVCVCNLSCAGCKANAPYCHLWPVRLYNTFPQYLITGTIFEKKVTEHKMCVWIFSTPFVWNISHSKKKWATHCPTVHKPSCKIPGLLSRFRWNCNFLERFSKYSQM